MNDETSTPFNDIALDAAQHLQDACGLDDQQYWLASSIVKNAILKAVLRQLESQLQGVTDREAEL